MQSQRGRGWKLWRRPPTQSFALVLLFSSCKQRFLLRYTCHRLCCAIIQKRHAYKSPAGTPMHACIMTHKYGHQLLCIAEIEPSHQLPLRLPWLSLWPYQIALAWAACEKICQRAPYPALQVISIMKQQSLFDHKTLENFSIPQHFWK